MPSLTGTLDLGTEVREEPDDDWNGFRKFLNREIVKYAGSLLRRVLTVSVLGRLGQLLHIEGEYLVQLSHTAILLYGSHLDQLILIVHVDELFRCFL